MTIYFPFSATIRKEENTYISICPEADIVCRGESIEEAVTNLKKEVEQFLEEELPRGFSKIVYY